MVRDRLTFISLLIATSAYVIVFGYAINPDPRHIETIAVDHDQREFSRLGLPAQEYWRLMGLLWALEGASMHLLTNPAHPADDVEACRRGLLTLWQQAVAA